MGAVAALGDTSDETGRSLEQIVQLLHAETKSRERLERKLMKTSRKMDQLAKEFTGLKNHLANSNVDLDLEKRKNTELRKRLDSDRTLRRSQRKL